MRRWRGALLPGAGKPGQPLFQKSTIKNYFFRSQFSPEILKTAPQQVNYLKKKRMKRNRGIFQIKGYGYEDCAELSSGVERISHQPDLAAVHGVLKFIHFQTDMLVTGDKTKDMGERRSHS